MADIIDTAAEIEELQRNAALSAHRLNRNAVSAERCAECGDPIPDLRRMKVPGVPALRVVPAGQGITHEEWEVMMDRSGIDAMLESMPRRQHAKSLVKGVGTNDALFCTGTSIEGKIVNHQAYDVWVGMLQRCYDKKFQAAHPHYAGCKVCDEWLTFTCFFAWWKENAVEGWDLDKDFKCQGNRIYSPQKCLFIPKFLNYFITAKPGRRTLPMGVHDIPKLGKYKCAIRTNGSYVHLGVFDTVDEANRAWLMAKLEISYSYKEICDQIWSGLFDRLIERVLEFSSQHLDHREAAQIRAELETREHIKSLRVQRAA